ncbi:DUF6044 family protein [Rubripirellula sp.]|nr:DUF6044 family protein [Rubripirellula sp.]
MFAGLVALTLGNWWYSRRFPVWLMLGIGAFFISTLVLSWPLVEGLIGVREFTSHRVERSPQKPIGEYSILAQSVFSQYHAPASPRPFVWAASLMAAIMAVRAMQGSREQRLLIPALLFVCYAIFVVSPSLQRSDLLVYVISIVAAVSLRPVLPPKFWMISIFSTIVAIILIAGFWIALNAQWLTWLPAAKEFNYARWYLFLPFILYVMFFVSAGYLAKAGKIGRWISYSLIICQLGMLFAGRWDGQLEDEGLTYKQYESKETFEQVAAIIDAPKESYRIACVGFFSVGRTFKRIQHDWRLLGELSA